MLFYIKNDLIATKIGLAMMWRNKKYFLFALLLTIYIAIMIESTIWLMTTLIPLIMSWASVIGTKSLLLKAIIWISRYFLLAPGIILTLIALEFMPVAIVYFTFQRFSEKNIGIVQSLAHTFAKLKKHGPFTPFHHPTPLYFFAPLMALEDIDWNGPVHKMHDLWNKTIFEKYQFFWWSRALFILLTIGIMINVLTMSVARANYLRQFGIDAVPAVFFAITTLEILIILSVWIARTIFKTALYSYSQGQPTGPFPPALVKDFFIEK